MMMKKLGIVVALIFLLALVLPFLVPTGTYLKQIEKIASEKLNQQVRIGSLHLALLPSPRLKLSEIVIGSHDEVRVGGVVVKPELSSLLSDVRGISAIEVNDPVVKKDALDFVAAMPKSESPSGPAPVLIKRVQISHFSLLWPGMDIPPLDIQTILAGENRVDTVHVAGIDGHFTAEVKPAGEGYSIVLNANKWTLPVGPKVVFDTLNSKMRLEGSKLNISSLDATLYRGRLAASADLDWGKGLQAAGKFKTNEIAVAEIAALFSKQKLLSGKLGGNGTFNLNAKDAAKAADHLVVDYQFSVADGVLHGVDLAKAATLLLNAKEKGGETQFDELSGHLHMAGKQMTLKDFKVASGLLAANGTVKVSASRQLDGVVDVELKKGMALATVPLQVSGTLDHPSVFPTKAALAGAAIGTGVLGPGVGTSLGVKAASGVEKLKGLFGK